jgi:ATPase subunit of ABC transporter with duplicated ATPase domains
VGIILFSSIGFLTMEALKKALLEFKGAIVGASHDATFIEKFGEIIWQL